MNNLLKFADKALSRAEMKSIKGGIKWCYAYMCTCGTVSYNGYGDLPTYQADARENCLNPYQGPVNCSFTELPETTCMVS